MAYKIGICDDENKYIKDIGNIIEDYFKDRKDDYEIYCFNDGYKLLDKADDLDIVFLDVEMDIVSGLEIKNKLTKLSDLRIIFVTNYEQYMSDAYGRNVIAYVNKSEIVRIKEILTKIENEDQENILLTLSDKTLDTYDIKYIKANGAYCSIYFQDQECVACIYLNDLLKRLPASFIRVHRSYVINLRYVRDFLKKHILLSDNTQIPISRSYREAVKKRYFDYVRGR